MATVYNPQQDEETQQQQQDATQGGASPTQPISVGGGESSTASGAAPGVTSSSGGQKAGSGRYLNIRKYLEANKGADYAGRIGQNIQQQGQQLQKGVETARQNVESQVNPELQRLQGAQGQIQQALANPSDFASNQSNVDAFNKLRTGNYLHDVNVNNIGDLLNQQQKAQEAANLAGSESGRYQLLRQTFGGNNYSRGANKLDQLLLQGQSGQLNQLQGAAQKAAQQAQQNVGNLQNYAQTSQEQLRQLGGAAQTAAQQGVTSAIDTGQQGLEQKAQALQAQRQQQYQGVLDALKAGKITQEQAQQLGITGPMNTYNVDVSSFLNPNVANQAVTRQNVATAEDAARFKALAALSGQQDLANYVNPQELAGPIQYNTQGLQSAVEGAKGGYEQEYNQAKQDAINQFKNEYGKTTFTKGGLGDQANQAIKSGDVNKMQQAYNKLIKIGHTTADPMTRILKQAIDSINKIQTSYTPNKQLQIG